MELTPPIVTPGDPSTKGKSTRQLLAKIPNHQGLYRHTVNGTYYGIAKVRGKRKEHSLGTTDRKLAERKLKEWTKLISDNPQAGKRKSLTNLIDTYRDSLAGLAAKTRATRLSILKRFEQTWTHGLNVQVAEILPSQLNGWIAQHEAKLKNTTYNEYARFLRCLFASAVQDGVIPKSPFDGVTRKWKKPEKPLRLTPTEQQFTAIIAEVRTQRFNSDADASADFLEFLGLAGLGQKEASHLLWRDIDFASRKIAVRRHKTGVLFTVPIYPDLLSFLERLRPKTHNGTNERVFAISDAKRALAAACKRLDLPPFSQRAIRRVLIRKLWQAGVDKKLIAKWQGHSDGGKLILDTYTESFSTDDDNYESLELQKLLRK